MKKISLIILCILILTGCQKDDKKVNVTFDNKYYQISSPYKKSIGGYSLKSYDKEEVENNLMNLSTKYFSPNNSYYEEGQYLNNDKIKELLSILNETKSTLGDNETKPTYVSSIYEQNYLSNNNNLKGISLAIVLNVDEFYEREGIVYNEVSKEEEVVSNIMSKMTSLLNNLRSIEQLKDTKIVIGLYIEGKSYVKGSFKYLGQTNDNNIKFEYVNYHYELLDNNFVLKNDLENYNNLSELKKIVNKYDNLFLMGMGMYKNNQLLKLNLTISSNYLKQSQILDISQSIGNSLGSFKNNIVINLSFVSNNKVKAILIKEDLSIKTYMMEE